jgi:hypothetical protein
VAAGFDRLLLAPASGSELVAALEVAAVRRGRPSGPGATPSACPVWLAAGERNAPAEIEADLSRAGFPPLRPATPGRAQAQAAGGEFGAVVVDLSDRHAGGFELAVELQAGRTPTMAWIALVPGELTSSERKRLVDFVEGASASAGGAVAAAAIRLTGRD